jgi:sugar transferase (PEP-CTERM/EpsH1 system associated)
MSGEILFLCHRVPYPPDRGDKIRSYHALKRLAEAAPVHLVCLADDAADEAWAEALAPLTASRTVVRRRAGRLGAVVDGVTRGRPLSLALFDHAAVHRAVAGRLATRPIAGLYAFSGQMAQFVPPLAPGTRFVMDFVDMDSAKFAGYAAAGRGPMAWVHAREARLLAAFEAATARRADLSLFVSAAEAALFTARTGIGERVRAIGNGVDLAAFDPAGVVPAAAGEGPLIVFTGQMDYPPNVEAVSDFAARVLPAVRARHPAARFAIVGRAPAPGVRALAADPAVLVTGEVPDVRPWLAAADVVVAPLRLARGIQNKLLEAMAMARPVVASTAAAEGLDVTPGAHLIVAPDAAAEAGAIGALLADPARAEAMGRAARGRMTERYDWNRALADLPALVLGER